MVCIRCKMLLRAEIEKMGLHATAVELGYADIQEPSSAALIKQLTEQLKHWGLEIINDKKVILVENIKNIVIEQVHYSDSPLTVNFSHHLENRLPYDYTYMSNLFATTNGITLEQYIIYHKIEKAKELLIYEDMSIKEIASEMNYSSAAHLSKQFKKVTGFTPKEFKKLNEIRMNTSGKHI